MGKKIRRSLNDAQIQRLGELRGCEILPTAKNQYYVTFKEYQQLRPLRTKYLRNESADKPVEKEEVSVDTDTISNEYKSETNYRLSAWNHETNKVMDIDTYCDHYGLPREDITSYKLVSFPFPYYNTVFKENVIVDFKSLEEIYKDIEDIVSRVKPAKIEKINYNDNHKIIDRLVYTDTHVGMDTDKDGTAMYSETWDEQALMDTLTTMVLKTIQKKRGKVLRIDDLGDFLDGWNGETTRGGHKLPQNMTNEKAFKVGLEFKVQMVVRLVQHYDKIICSNVCEDNHAGQFGAILNHSFKRIVELMFPGVVEVNNYGKFIDHYYEGSHCIILSHGKDSKSLKFGFKPQLDPNQIQKIDHYIKHNESGNIFRYAKYIRFCKGDSHQALFDWASAQDFDYMNYMALSPPSEWVQTNFKKGRRGFVLEYINPDEENIDYSPIFL